MVAISCSCKVFAVLAQYSIYSHLEITVLSTETKGLRKMLRKRQFRIIHFSRVIFRYCDDFKQDALNRLIVQMNKKKRPPSDDLFSNSFIFLRLFHDELRNIRLLVHENRYEVKSSFNCSKFNSFNRVSNDFAHFT